LNFIFDADVASFFEISYNALAELIEMI